MNPIFIVLPILTILTYSLGLTLKSDDFKMLLKKPLPMAVGLTGQLVVLRIIYFAKFFQTESVYSTVKKLKKHLPDFTKSSLLPISFYFDKSSGKCCVRMVFMIEYCQF